MASPQEKLTSTPVKNRYAAEEQDEESESPGMLSPLPSPLSQRTTPNPMGGRRLKGHAEFGSLVSESPLVRSFNGGMSSATRPRKPSLSKSFSFGSPSYPSPLDRIRGFDRVQSSSAYEKEMNSTWHGTQSTQAQQDSSVSHHIRGKGKLSGFGLDSFDFGRFGAEVKSKSQEQLGSMNLSASWLFTSSSMERQVTSSARNPNKAVVTINGEGTILISNEKACELFTVESSELVGRVLDDFVKVQIGAEQVPLRSFLKDDPSALDGVNGRVVDLIRKDKNIVSVSVWLSKLGAGGEASTKESKDLRFLAVMEQVDRSSSIFACDEQLNIVWCDETFAEMHGYELDEILGVNLALLAPIKPSMVGSDDIFSTFTTKEGQVFPSHVILQPCNETERFFFMKEMRSLGLDTDDDAICISGVHHMFGNLSGLVSVKEDGTIFGCNASLMRLLFGRQAADIKDKHVRVLLPLFEKDMQVLSDLAPHDGGVVINEGIYKGIAVHASGVKFPISYQVKRVQLSSEETLFCIWISHQQTPSVLQKMRVYQNEFSNNMLRKHQLLSRHGSKTKTAPESTLAASAAEPHISEEYARVYQTLEEIGKGAFGFVKLAERRSDGAQVVVKFIKKDAVLAECWEKDEDLFHLPKLQGDIAAGYIPREILLLSKLSHPHIVSLLDVFHSLEYYQIVMERHGPGFDMFEFINENPQVDESLASYIFRQVLSGVDYLHEQKILHRDLKDENIILDLEFNAKIIDFGSAAYMVEGKLFDTFCGTIEYCAPEVLEGNPYRGPELEVFSLGVTLYSLVYGENPFFDIEETIAGEIRPPFAVSPECFSLVTSLLCRDPATRITVKGARKHPWITMDVREAMREILNNPEWVAAKEASKNASMLDDSLHSEGEDDGPDEHAQLYDEMFGEDLRNTQYNGYGLAITPEPEDSGRHKSCTAAEKVAPGFAANVRGQGTFDLNQTAPL